MKKFLIYFLSFLFLYSYATAQAPSKINYQGIARKTDGTPIADQQIHIRISIGNNATINPSLYRELHLIRTDRFGLYNLAIGSGTVVTGTFAGINWASGDKYVGIEIDPAGGNNFQLAGTTQLLSVPFALYAASGNQGPQGLKGDKGDIGAQGLQGLKGDTGLKGDKGDTGAQGLQGLKGDKGDTGAQGLQGLKGDPGSNTSSILKLTFGLDSAYSNFERYRIKNGFQSISISSGNYDPANGEYTIPATGVYQIVVSYELKLAVDNRDLQFGVELMKGVFQIDNKNDQIKSINSGYDHGYQFSSVQSLNVGDKIWLQLLTAWGGSTPKPFIRNGSISIIRIS